MAYKIGALVLHGIGNQLPNFADDVIKELSKQVGKMGGDASEICWKPVHWAPILQKRQEEFWELLLKNDRMGQKTLRQLAIYTFGDAIAYLQRAPHQDEDMYKKIHNLVRDKAGELHNELGGDKPLVVVAHSLGTVIISNYIWDEQNSEEAGESGVGRNDFESMKTLAGLYTFGTNIALVTLAYNPVESIRFPHNNLHQYFSTNPSPEDVSNAAKWLNFYDKDDILGYPLRSLKGYWENPPVKNEGKVNTYADAVTADLEINAGHLLQSWNPWSHTGYWTDKDFTRPVAQSIADILKLL